MQFPRFPAKGYAARKPHGNSTRRIVNLLLSDLHFGADLNAQELLSGYGAIEESRRLAAVIAQTCHYKTQHRDQTRLNVLLNGDIIEGLLGHDDRSAAPLAEQYARAVWLLVQAIGRLAEHFGDVHVYCASGNHGRILQRHPDRATTGKWDSFESMIYIGVREALRHLPNVKWTIPQTAWTDVPLFDRWLFQTHGDTLLSKNPAVSTFEGELAKINASRRHHKYYDVFAIGHWHLGRCIEMKAGRLFVNGALVPANQHAQAIGADSLCGQWLWESVEAYPVGDRRFLEVDERDDARSDFDAFITPWTGEVHFS